MNVFWFDTETGGLDSLTDGLIELGYIVEIDKKVMESGCLKMNPSLLDKKLNPQSLEVNKLTEQEIKLYPSPLQFYESLIEILGRYINRYDKLQKFHLAGFNVKFDEAFLRQFFKDMGDNYYGSWFSNRLLDVFSIMFHYVYQGKFPELDSYTLTNVAYVLGIESDSFHSAEEDIRITREIYLKLLEIDSLTN